MFQPVCRPKQHPLQPTRQRFSGTRHGSTTTGNLLRTAFPDRRFHGGASFPARNRTRIGSAYRAASGTHTTSRPNDGYGHASGATPFFGFSCWAVVAMLMGRLAEAPHRTRSRGPPLVAVADTRRGGWRGRRIAPVSAGTEAAGENNGVPCEKDGYYISQDARAIDAQRRVVIRIAGSISWHRVTNSRSVQPRAGRIAEEAAKTIA